MPRLCLPLRSCPLKRCCARSQCAVAAGPQGLWALSRTPAPGAQASRVQSPQHDCTREVTTPLCVCGTWHRQLSRGFRGPEPREHAEETMSPPVRGSDSGLGGGVALLSLRQVRPGPRGRRHYAWYHQVLAPSVPGRATLRLIWSPLYVGPRARPPVLPVHGDRSRRWQRPSSNQNKVVGTMPGGRSRSCLS